MPTRVLVAPSSGGYLRVRVDPVPESLEEAMRQLTSKVIHWREMDFIEEEDTFKPRVVGTDILARRLGPGRYEVLPLGLGYILRWLDEHGHDVTVAAPPGMLEQVEAAFKSWFKGWTCDWRGPEPRPYQREAADLAAKEWFTTHELPTGSGKTVLMGLVVCRYGLPALVLEPTRDLVEQTYQRFKRWGLPVCRDDMGCPVTVTTYQGLAKRLAGWQGWVHEAVPKAVLIADEGHHIPARTWRRPLLANPWRAIALFSARFDRGDASTDVFEIGRRYRKSYRELVDEGWLAPLRFAVVTTDPTGLLDELQVLARDYRQYRARVGPRLQRLFAPELARVAEALLGRHRKVIVFLDYVEAVELAARELGRRGVDAAVLHGRLPLDRRVEALEAFRRGDARVLVVSPAGNEGLDIPDADAAVMPAPVPRELRFIQRVGRVSRAAPGKDYAGVYVVSSALRRADAPPGYPQRIRVWRDTAYLDLRRVAAKYYGVADVGVVSDQELELDSWMVMGEH